MLSVLPEVIERTRGEIVTFTTSEAAYLARLAVVARDATAWDRYLIARVCARRHEASEPTVDLDAFVAHRPWVSRENRHKYAVAVGLGDISPAVGYRKGRSDDLRWEDAVTEQERIRELNQRAINPYLDDIRKVLEHSQPGQDEQPHGR